MSQLLQTVVGIDVGGDRKGFHAVALRGDAFVDKTTSADPAAIVDWCCNHNAVVVSVDAPCGWSQTGSSRLAERELKLSGKKIHCFATPTRERAENHDKGFYDWVFNSENLYMRLRKHYQLFDGRSSKSPCCFETFPHAIVCAMEGCVVSAKSKLKVRRKVLQNRGYDTSNLSNIDFVDAALCAVVADEFGKGNYQCFGNPEEGFIVVPVRRAALKSID